MPINLLADEPSQPINLLEGEDLSTPEYPTENLGVLGNLKRAAGIAANDIGKGIGDAAQWAEDAINAAPNQIPGATKQLINNPGRFLKNVGISGSEAEKAIVNTPSAISRLLSHLGMQQTDYLPNIGQELKKMSPDEYAKAVSMQKEPIGEYIKSTMGEEQPGDKLIQGLVPAAMMADPALQVGKLGLAGVKGVKDVLMGAGKKAELAQSLNLPEKLAQEQAARMQMEEAKQAENIAKQSSEQETGKNKPSSMEFASKKAQDQLNELEKPETSNLPIESTQATEQQLNNAEANHAANQRNLQDVENQIAQHLNRGASHDVNAASQILDIQEGPINPRTGRREGGIRPQISRVYDDLINGFRNRNVAIDNEPAIQNAMARLSELSRQGEFHGPESLDLQDQIQRLSNEPSGSIPADQYLTMLRSAKDYARDARAKAFQPDMNAEDRAAWARRYNELDEQIEGMEDHFQNAVGPQDAAALRNANYGWRHYVKPLQRSPLYQEIRHRGRINGDIMEKLRGHGQAETLMRNIVTQHPGALRNVVGQRYADNINALHNRGELERAYTSQMPELNNMLTQHQQLQEATNNSQTALDRARQRHTRAITREEKAQVQASKQAEKSSKYEKEKSSLQAQKDKLDKNIQILKEKAKDKNLSLEKHIQAKKQLERAQKKYDDTNFRLKFVIKMLGKAAAKTAKTVKGMIT